LNDSPDPKQPVDRDSPFWSRPPPPQLGCQGPYHCRQGEGMGGETGAATGERAS
jgi:hypothetical protein